MFKTNMFKNNIGFTLLEVTAVIVLIGIISAVIISTYTYKNTNLVSSVEVLKTDLRYAQLRSMNSESVWGITYDTCADGNRLWLYKDGDTDNKVLLPGEDSDTINLSKKGVSMGAFIISFNSWGMPCTDAEGKDPFQDSDETLTMSLISGSEEKQICITKNTGFIQ